LHFNTAKCITEDYGYKLNDCIPDKDFADQVQEGDYLYKSDNYDEDGNYAYGTNLKAVYLCWKNLTYEDGIVITESAAKKLTSYKVEKTMFTINGNDILLNLYGDNTFYKAIPHVGDHVDSKVLVASRRHDKRTALYELQTGKMQHIDPDNDEILYTSGGTIVDIDVFSNKRLEDLRKSENKMFNSELISIIENNHRYWSELASELEKIIPCKYLTEDERNKEKAEFGHFCKHPIDRDQNPNKYSDELAYYWKLAHEYIDENIQWRYDGKSFDNFRIQFTILKENPLTPSCKITNRYGGKGVITSIIPDEEAPVNEYGERAEIILNSLGIINRMNLSTLKEHYINFMSDHVLRIMKSKDNYEEKAKIFFEYLKEINKEEYEFYDIEYTMMNREEREEFIDNVETNGIYIHETPFFKNTSMEQFKEMFKKHPEWCDEYKFSGIEKPLTMGDIYFIRLKHDFSNKTSLRSAANLNVKNLPAKSALKKEKKVLYSNNPLRLGEMEVTNLMLGRRPDLVEKLLKTYSTNETLREQTISQLLDPGKTPGGHIKNTLNMNLEVDTKNNRAISREILDKYLNVLGYSIEDNDDK
jgi:DNA-directed RNA polymerase beta subunit